MIRLLDVSVEFEAGLALSGIDLEVPEGCVYGLIGPGASGKSVLLKVIAGLYAASGETWVNGRELSSLPPEALSEHQSGIGMLFQNNALFDFMTVGDNVAFPLRRLTALDEESIRERVSARLDAVGLPNFEHRMPAGLSGGQKKRVGVARATITEAAILLYDEPAAGLDPVSTQKLLELLRKEQQAQGSTVMMVSSDVDRLLTVTDRVGMLHEGRLIFDGSTDQARTSTNVYVRQFVDGTAEGPL